MATRAIASQSKRSHHVGACCAACGCIPACCAHPSSLAERPLCRQPPEVGAECVNCARSDLCGGYRATGIPTAIPQLDYFMAAKSTKTRPAFDQVISDIADYVERYRVKSALALETAHYCLIDSLGCGFEALGLPACTKLLGPLVPGTAVEHGARVPGTSFVLDPVHAAFNIGALIRWVDYNDAFYGATVIHPSDTLSGILATADWLSRTRVANGKPPLMMREVLEATVKAYEIMGCLALENGFGPVGLDHTILVKIAVTAVVTKMLGGTREEIMNAVSNAWLDGHP